jgi:hypothetical protein
MIEIVAAVIAVLFLLCLSLYAFRLSRFRAASCYVSRREDAEIFYINSYVDDGFSSAQKAKAFTKSKAKCQCCGIKTFLGEADTASEYIIGLVFGAREGQLHHVISRKYRGPSVIENAAWLCGKCNIAISDTWTKESERVCVAQGWKVYLTPEERRQPLRSWKEIVASARSKKRGSRARTKFSLLSS